MHCWLDPFEFSLSFFLNNSLRYFMIADMEESRRKGVTLVELLFVALCVGILFAVFQPSLQSSLQLSRNVICLDRLRAIGQATVLYSADDANNMAIPVHRGWPDPFYDDRDRPVGAYEWGGKSGRGQPDFIGSYAPVHSAFGTFAGFGPATRPLNEIMYKGGFRNNAPDAFYDYSEYDRIGAANDMLLNLDAFRCPADDGPPDGGHCPDWVSHPEDSSFDHFGTSFAANIFMITNSGGGPLISNSPYLGALSRIVEPTQTLMYEENIGRWAWASRNEIPACQSALGLKGIDPGPTKVIRGWHGKNWTYNRAFADAHAESQAIFVEGTSDNDGYANHYRTEYVENLPQWPVEDIGGDNDFLNEMYKCVIVRGDGWQKDTFPAELIPTGKHWSGGGRPSYEFCVQSSDEMRTPPTEEAR